MTPSHAKKPLQVLHERFTFVHARTIVLRVRDRRPTTSYFEHAVGVIERRNSVRLVTAKNTVLISLRKAILQGRQSVVEESLALLAFRSLLLGFRIIILLSVNL